MPELELIKKAVSEAMQSEMKDFYIDRERHYQDHEFIGEIREWAKGFKSAFWSRIACALAYGIVTVVFGYAALRCFKGD